MEQLAVEWLVDQIAENLGIRVKNSSIGVSLVEQAKAMEEDGNHKAYLHGHEVGFMKADERQREQMKEDTTFKSE